ncbi:molecular chaperone DjiA [Rubellimicrobium aerolatum]|uniref:TerB family tellurite resistance protein n=1 Tax=Rubellimicrobium aerolatum TaxID=490979 RepID=A0ABW0S914_9RHOB|nr:molecular chaperone DjiA [Rubellimicrobium aerolatum]MBP1804788.1 DnaJ like chaperone protein [Rubellimicrobium aerolatum]
MSIWTRVTDLLARLARGDGLSTLFEQLRTPPEKTVGFAIATVALGAKIAKADGLVTRNEVAAFREVFIIPEGEEGNVARVYDLARQDTAGFEDYARRIRAMFGEGAAQLGDLLEGLFHIAVADGDYHPEENRFIARVAEIFHLPEPEFLRIRAEFVPDAERDPYDVLGVPHGASLEEARAAWRALVRETHPDRLLAHGLPEEAIRLAEKRLICINQAWERISAKAA